ncbi:MAG: lysophospholipase [Bacilli bacterium]|nr:lysophospholipase [Bacilli bacterium]
MGAKAIYKKMFNSRIEPRFTVKYMDYKFFGDLKRTPLIIKNKFGDDIQCYFYFHEDYKIRRDLIIFSHGYGGGHSAYLKEIYSLAKAGNLVLAYDQAGAIESGGTLRGFTSMLSDLEDIINYLRKDEDYYGHRIKLVGHSMGGFASLAVLNIFDDIQKVVALAPAPSFKKQVRALTKIPFAPSIFLSYEKKSMGKYATMTALDGMNKAKHTRILLVQSLDDPTVPYKISTKYLSENTLNPNLSIETVNGVYHQTCFTKEASQNLTNYFKSLKGKSEEEIIAYRDSVDWSKLYQVDEETMKKITDFLDRR